MHLNRQFGSELRRHVKLHLATSEEMSALDVFNLPSTDEGIIFEEYGAGGGGKGGSRKGAGEAGGGGSVRAAAGARASSCVVGRWRT